MGREIYKGYEGKEVKGHFGHFWYDYIRSEAKNEIFEESLIYIDEITIGGGGLFVPNYKFGVSKCGEKKDLANAHGISKDLECKYRKKPN